MPELYKKHPRNFTAYDTMSSAALEEILRADAQKLDDEIDVDAICYITNLLEERARENNEHTVDVEALLAKMPFTAETGHVPSQNAEKLPAGSKRKPSVGKKKHTKLRHILRLCAATAAVVCVLFVLSGVASAFGFNVWTKLAVWTDEVFGVVSNCDVEMPVKPEDEEGYVEYGSLQEALDAFEIDAVKEPDILRYNLILNDLTVLPHETDTVILADYYDTGTNCHMAVSIQTSNEAAANFYERNGDLASRFMVDNVQCYTVSNNNNYSIVWMVEDYECSVVGTIPMEKLKEIAISMIE